MRVPLGIDEGGFAYVAERWTRHGSSLYGSMWVDRPPGLLALFRLAGAFGPEGVRALGLLAAVALTLLVAALGRLVVDRPAAMIAAGVLAATLSSSVALRAVATPGELLAAVPSTGAVLCGLLALRRGDGRWLVAAGALAVCAPLVKQSALDGAVALGALLVGCRWRRETGPWRAWWPAAAALGALLPLVALEGYEHWAGLGDGAMSYALLGFRFDGLRSLASTGGSFATSLAALALPAAGAGLPVLLGLAFLGARALGHRTPVGLTVAAWLAAASVGVLGGGSYWPHYLIQLIAPTCVLAAIGMPAAAWPRRALVAAVVALNVVIAVVSVDMRTTTHPDAGKLAVASYVRTHARPGDTDDVLWARSDLLYYAGLPTPFPYAWSLMDRARPGLPARLRALLASSRAPTWLVEWQPPDAWGLDPAGRLTAVIARRYVRRAVVAGHPVLELRRTTS